jgi:hypothetical protein
MQSLGKAAAAKAASPPHLHFERRLGIQVQASSITTPSCASTIKTRAGRSGAHRSQDANSLQYDSAYYILSPTNFASARTGINFGKMQISAFCDNLFDTHTVTNYEWSINPSDGNSRLERQFTLRPRTVGRTFTYCN